MCSSRSGQKLLVAWASVATLAVAQLFYRSGRAASGGAWPAPLDDVYIHYDFARSFALGHPFEWIAGQGYSSGETSPLYAFVLAIGYAVGFRDARLGYWAAFVALGSLVTMMWALIRVTTRRTGRRMRRAWPALLLVPVMFASGTLDFAWFSGMEVALFGAIAGALVLSVDEAMKKDFASRAIRTRRQWRVGGLGALLVLVRPEAAVVVAVAMFVVARSVGAASPVPACVRVALPGACATLCVAVMNWLGTGSFSSAGALLKLLSSNPFLSDEDRAREYVTNLFALVQTMRHDLGTDTGRAAYLLPLLAFASLSSRRTRALGVLCLASALSFVLLASWNGAARYQNFRDYMPPLSLVLFAAVLGLAALVASRTRLVRALGVAIASSGAFLGASHVAEAARLYASASRNIHDQQVTAGSRLGERSSPDAIVLVGDAGAIPYVSGLHAVDALGLGGYHGLPFVRAAVHGEAATLELIERLPARERPTHLALYANWFPGITSRFGHLREEITITDNVICGGVTKGLYDADWSSMLADDEVEVLHPGVLDVVDVVDIADVVSEEAHDYRSPAPRGGWTLFDVRRTPDGATRFDGGRIVPEEEEESFVSRAAVPAGGTLVLRVDDSVCEVVVRVTTSDSAPTLASSGTSTALVSAEAHAWRTMSVSLVAAIHPGDRIHVRVVHGSLHDFHAWLLTGKP